MSIFVIADLHLSLSVDKPMDIFGGWTAYVNRIDYNWQHNVKPEDTVVRHGGVSCAMSLEQSAKDFEFINKLNGRKIILKGNHDYWWNTKNKMDKFFAEKGFDTLNILHNNHYEYEGIGICGSRGWINETEEPADKKVLAREAGRLTMSIESALKAGLKPVAFLHYPPIYGTSYNYDMLEVLHKYNIEWCFYGHIHGRGTDYAINGTRDGVNYRLVSSDYLKFDPLDITDIVKKHLK